MDGIRREPRLALLLGLALVRLPRSARHAPRLVSNNLGFALGGAFCKNSANIEEVRPHGRLFVTAKWAIFVVPKKLATVRVSTLTLDVTSPFTSSRAPHETRTRTEP